MPPTCSCASHRHTPTHEPSTVMITEGIGAQNSVPEPRNTRSGGTVANAVAAWCVSRRTGDGAVPSQHLARLRESWCSGATPVRVLRHSPHAPSTLRANAMSWACWNGLVIHPVAPAALACCFIPASDSVVRNTIGTPERRQLAQLADQREPVHHGHVQVSDHHVDDVRTRLGKALCAVGRLHDLIACADQRQLDHLQHAGGVINGEDHLAHDCMAEQDQTSACTTLTGRKVTVARMRRLPTCSAWRRAAVRSPLKPQSECDGITAMTLDLLRSTTGLPVPWTTGRLRSCHARLNKPLPRAIGRLTATARQTPVEACPLSEPSPTSTMALPT